MFRWRNIVAAAVRNSGGCFKEGNLEVFIRKQSTMGDKFRLPDRFGTGEKSVWVEYIALAAEVKPAVNLGQGFPDYPMPKHASEALARIACSDNPLVHQYTRGFGHPRLVQALANLYSPLIGRELDPLNEIIVSTGAYEALYCAILGHVSPGEEVIIIEPFFDCYEYMVRIAGGIPKFISLEALKKKCECLSSADWHFDEEEMKNLFNPTTKMIILNTPHNPLGKVFKKEELEFIADLCKQHNVLCLADEVYEWMVYKPNQHIRMATLPGMWERTITVGSAGKTFSATGWKIGWAYGPANLMNNLQVVHQNCVYTCCTPIQEAIAQAFETELARRQSPECFLNAITDELLPKRDYMVKILKANGFKPTIPEGGYFIIADWTKLKPFIDLTTEQDSNMDYRFTKKLAKVAGVLAIPPSAFYSEENKKKGEDYARFCFIKKQENLQLAESLLTAWRN